MILNSNVRITIIDGVIMEIIYGVKLKHQKGIERKNKKDKNSDTKVIFNLYCCMKFKSKLNFLSSNDIAMGIMLNST